MVFGPVNMQGDVTLSTHTLQVGLLQRQPYSMTRCRKRKRAERNCGSLRRIAGQIIDFEYVLFCSQILNKPFDMSFVYLY